MLPIDQVPAYLVQNAGLVAKVLVNLTSRVLTAREEHESCDDEE